MDISHAQSSSDPSAPAQNAEIVYTMDRSRLLYIATYSYWKLRVMKRLKSQIEAIVVRTAMPMIAILALSKSSFFFFHIPIICAISAYAANHRALVNVVSPNSIKILLYVSLWSP